MLIIARELLDPPTLILSIKGPIDKSSFGEVQQALDELLRRVGLRVVIDMSVVNKINSQGIGLLIGYARTIRQRGGRMSLACVNLMVEQVLRVTRVHEAIPIHSTVKDALVAFDIAA